MIDRAYMLEKPAGPSAAERYLHQVVVPLAIDAAGAGEVAVQRLSQRTGLRPAVLMAGLTGGLLVLVAAAVQARRRARF